MKTKGTFLHAWRQPALMLALTLMVFRALLPAGFMPVFSAAGMPQMVICSGLGTKTIPGDAEHAPRHDLTPCAFAVNLGGPAPDAALVLPVLAAGIVNAAIVLAAAPQTYFRLYASRAPPQV